MIEIERHALRVGLEVASVAQSSDDLRPHLAGVQLVVEGNELVTCATDGHRLMRVTVPQIGKTKALSERFPDAT